MFVYGRFREWKHVIRRDRQERPIESFLEVAIVGGDRVVNGDKIGARGKGTLDHQFGE